MLKAHIFVCIAIADWNTHVGVKNRKTTMIGTFFKNSLHVSIDYDFVFGINIGLDNACAGFDSLDFDHKIRTIMTGLNMPLGNDIQLENGMKFVAPYFKKSTKIGMVQIVICAIPRQKKTVLWRSSVRLKIASGPKLISGTVVAIWSYRMMRLLVNRWDWNIFWKTMLRLVWDCHWH
jgi:hypothetical protein